mmetsp:Transcript_12120/g.14793  ORF Transcript_12120/g.14793 Transcript_12120/m.14793 type:complete len:380 (-) Transcript_12120:90-1229(-)
MEGLAHAAHCNSAESKCKYCRSNIKRLSKRKKCDQCHALLCSKCIDLHPLILKNDTEMNTRDQIISRLCSPCFRHYSILDFDSKFDVIDTKSSSISYSDTTTSKEVKDNFRYDQSSSSSPIVFVFAHGMGGNKANFRGHAQEMFDRFGHKSILFDFPGHGSRESEEITLESCAIALKEALKNSGIIYSLPYENENNDNYTTKNKLIYVGASFGAYIGFYLLSKFKKLFSGAVLMSCGHDMTKPRVGIGIWIFGIITSRMSNLQFMSLYTKKAGVEVSRDYIKIDYSSMLRGGVFFEQSSKMFDCMQSVNPADYIPHLSFPLLYLNGSNDWGRANSDKRWLKMSIDQDNSRLKVYYGGDHFFSHDSRFFDDVINEINRFV